MSNFLWIMRNGSATERTAAARIAADHAPGYRRALEDLVFGIIAGRSS